ncbi:hypothetical protein [Micromonospora sp. CA-111912]|uniref:hypothetical protein n=1 Tax=Micromonospora sp. CA-111912 TaxID=3239955 RepID=UPI003D90EE53
MKWLRRPVVLASLLVVGLAVGLTWALFPRDRAAPEPRERRYETFSACLLTDDKGLAGEHAKAAWSGMQAVSVAHSIKVQYLAVEGPQTPANALAYFNTLALEGCGVVVAVGGAPVAAVGQGRWRFPNPRYVAVGSEGGVEGVRRVPAATGDGIRSGVEAAVGEAWAEAPTR